MKRFIYTLVLSLLVSGIIAQNRKSSPAIVDTVSGIPVFVYSTPADDYEVVGKALSVGNIVLVMVDEEANVTDKTSELVNKALERVKKGKVPEFDAIIFDLNKEKTRAIKFKEGVSTRADVEKYEGVPVYIFSQPVEPYEVIDSFPADYSRRAQRGMLLDKIESMVNRIIRKEEEGKLKKFDALIINPHDLSETVIRFR